MGRKKSGIVRIRLNTPTIQGYSLEPAPVNFFYGKNGVGKTSIGRALADPNAEITWKDGKALQVFLFNEDYTEQVIQSVSGLPGVYALSGKNADIQRQIEEKTARKEQIDKKVQDLVHPARFLLSHSRTSSPIRHNIIPQPRRKRVANSLRRSKKDRMPSTGISEKLLNPGFGDGKAARKAL